MSTSTIKSLVTLRDELHEKLLSNPDYRALLSIDRLIGELESDFGSQIDFDNVSDSGDNERIIIADNDYTS